MGQKCNPTSVRLCINKFWSSVWYGQKDYSDKLHQDLMIRKEINRMFEGTFVSSINIKRFAKKVSVTIHSSKTWLILGKHGENAGKLKAVLEKITGSEVTINVLEVKKVDVNAKLIGEGIAQQIKRRLSYKKAMNKAVQMAIKSGASGVKIIVSGRLNGAEIARTEGSQQGSVPLHTFRANVDYHSAEAHTTYGRIGIKVWIFSGYSKNAAYLDLVNADDYESLRSSRGNNKDNKDVEASQKEPIHTAEETPAQPA